MAEMVDEKLFAELAKRKKEEVILPDFCEYDENQRCYTVKAWNCKYAVFPQQAVIKALDGTPEPHGFFNVFLVNYLLSRKKEVPTGRWISEKDLTGGATFFRGPHKIPTERITATFFNDISLLQKKCRDLGGSALDLADCSFSFDIIGSVRVALLYWIGDDDFPAEARLLLDQSVAATLSLDVVYGLLCDCCIRMSE